MSIARGSRAFRMVARCCGAGHRREAAVFSFARSDGATTSAAKRWLCVEARSAGFASEHQGREIVSISRGSRLNGRAKLRFLVAAAKRRFCCSREKNGAATPHPPFTSPLGRCIVGTICSTLCDWGSAHPTGRNGMSYVFAPYTRAMDFVVDVTWGVPPK